MNGNFDQGLECSIHPIRSLAVIEARVMPIIWYTACPTSIDIDGKKGIRYVVRCKPFPESAPMSTIPLLPYVVVVVAGSHEFRSAGFVLPLAPSQFELWTARQASRTTDAPTVSFKAKCGSLCTSVRPSMPAELCPTSRLIQL